jgi:3-methylfumaryl-CoA hydratase
MDDYQSWLGRTETASDNIGAFPVAALAATLDRADNATPPQPGDVLPPLWHWLYFLPTDRHSTLAEDGHVARGGFLPPIDLPRRMWAGSRFQFHAPLRIGDAATRVSRIANINAKQGRSGPLVFVTVHHDIANAAGPAIHEEHDIVYRGHEAGSAPQPPAAPATSDWTRTVHPSDVLLFRYSALTFNGHRIHYDRRYCTDVEHYPGLVVHGPLIATLLLDMLREHQPAAHLKTFQFRAVSPLFDIAPFTLHGNADGQLWAANSAGHLAMDATATF